MEKGAGPGDDLDRPGMLWDGTQYLPRNFHPEPVDETVPTRRFFKRLKSRTSASNSAYGVQFRPGDLGLNRSGHMSVTQRLRLFRGDVEWWLMAVLLIACPALVFVAIRAGLLPLSFIKNMKLVGYGLYSLCVGLWALYRAIDVGVDVARGHVRSELTRLPVSPSAMEQHRTFFSFRTDDGAEVRVPRFEFSGINPDDLYRVFFAPLSKQLINLEDAGPSYGVIPRL